MSEIVASCSVTDSKLESTTADVRRLTEECDGLRARLLQDRKTAALANAELKQQLERVWDLSVCSSCYAQLCSTLGYRRCHWPHRSD